MAGSLFWNENGKGGAVGKGNSCEYDGAIFFINTKYTYPVRKKIQKPISAISSSCDNFFSDDLCSRGGDRETVLDRRTQYFSSPASVGIYGDKFTVTVHLSMFP